MNKYQKIFININSLKKYAGPSLISGYLVIYYLMFNLVVAKHNEDVQSWIDSDPIRDNCNVFLYNKGGDFTAKHLCHYQILPNIGRESHTYLTHIVDNYKNLSDITIFLQGNPFPHSYNEYGERLWDFIEILKTEKNIKYLPLYGLLNEFKRSRQMYGYYGESTSDPRNDVAPAVQRLAKRIFSENVIIPEKLYFTTGAQFACSKEVIHYHSKSFYKKCLDLHEESTEDAAWMPYVMERFWRYIFQDDYLFYKNIRL